MVVGGSQQETLDPGFVLLGTRQKMVVGGSQQETLDPGFVLLGTRQHVPVILGELVLQPPSKISIYSARSVESPRLVTTLQHDRYSQYIVPAVSSHLDWWPHCNMIDSIRSALIIRTRHAWH
ncbi:unnamed protein product [Schistosoma mattheei]|uniref:Uncharacterized protein n=1 Tax=Schistosoma mattheei TaxID=31246 RepID=A0A183NR85_9TREM|nr:unnamed protein product [Schistosoma mattheei]